MNEMHKQITELNSKVDKLSEVVERLSQQITLISLPKEARFQSDQELSLPKESQPIVEQELELSNSEQEMMAHKDILRETYKAKTSYSQMYGENHLSPEIQIRRLTAQLTAAYNRIAVLEEQLLSRRSHI